MSLSSIQITFPLLSAGESYFAPVESVACRACGTLERCMMSVLSFFLDITRRLANSNPSLAAGHPALALLRSICIAAGKAALDRAPGSPYASLISPGPPSRDFQSMIARLCEGSYCMITSKEKCLP